MVYRFFIRPIWLRNSSDNTSGVTVASFTNLILTSPKSPSVHRSGCLYSPPFPLVFYPADLAMLRAHQSQEHHRNTAVEGFGMCGMRQSIQFISCFSHLSTVLRLRLTSQTKSLLALIPLRPVYYHRCHPFITAFAMQAVFPPPTQCFPTPFQPRCAPGISMHHSGMYSRPNAIFVEKKQAVAHLTTRGSSSNDKDLWRSILSAYPNPSLI